MLLHSHLPTDSPLEADNTTRFVRFALGSLLSY